MRLTCGPSCLKSLIGCSTGTFMLAPVTFLVVRPITLGGLRTMAYTTGIERRPADHGLERPDPNGEDEVRLDLRLDLGELLPAAVEVAVHVVHGDDLVRRRLP